MHAFVIAVVLAAIASPAAEPSAEETLVSERLSSRAMAVIDGIIGPGRARVLLEVRGERLQIRSEAEIMTPLSSPGGSNASSSVKEALRILDLPGYYKDRSAAAADKVEKEKAAAPPTTPSLQPFQKSFEQSLRDAGFEIKRIEAVVVLDSALSETDARAVSQLLPQLLRIDDSRGDKLSIVRAAMRPAWKLAFSTPADWRALSLAGGAVLAALFVAMILSGALVRAARVFAMELGHRRPMETLPAAQGGELLPELTPGMPAGLIEASRAGSGDGPVLALGQRFDFLVDADASGAARILAGEKPEDLAQVFAYLSKTHPETASRLFARLSGDTQADASASLLKLSVMDPERLAEIEERLKVSVANGMRGSERLAAILSRVPSEARMDILGRLAVNDSNGVAEIESSLFSFEDIRALSDPDFRRLLSEIPYGTWGAALRGAPQDLLQRVLSDLPQGPNEEVRQASAEPQAKDKISAARSKILDAFFQLSSKGLIRIDRPGMDEEIL